MFLNIIELESQKSKDTWRFKCLLNVIIIRIKLVDYDDLLGSIKDILKCMDKVSRNEANEAIDAIILNVNNSQYLHST